MVYVTVSISLCLYMCHVLGKNWKTSVFTEYVTHVLTGDQ